MTTNEQHNKDIDEVKEIAGYLWERGWAERNGGNISLRLKAWDGEIRSEIITVADIPTNLANAILYISGTGCRMRDLARYPFKYGAIIKISDNATGYYFLECGQGETNVKPTMELGSHLELQSKMSADNPEYRAVLHTHPVELICLTHNPEFARAPERLRTMLWSTMPESRVFIPRGVELTKYSIPGGTELSKITGAALQDFDVVLWEKHGALATGRDIIEAFDFIDVANKSATIILKCMAAGYLPEGLSQDNLEEMERILVNKL